MNSTMTPHDIDAVCDLVGDLCGLCWDESKAYLIMSRLATLVTRHGCQNYADFAHKVRTSLVPNLQAEVIDAVTTHETLWFRDGSPFDAIRYKILPEMIDSATNKYGKKRLRIWSAACSTGQESYSIAMALLDVVPDIFKWDVQIFGTDISAAAVEYARRGHYGQLEMSRGMDPTHLLNGFVVADGGWRVRDKIRAMCRFEVRNLLEPFTGMGPFHVIFCRNVGIYFTPEDRRSMFQRMGQILTPDGWFMAGSAESLTDLGPRWAPQFHCRANCYRPNMLTPVGAR